MNNGFDICKKTRKFTAESLHKVLKKLLQGSRSISEVDLRDAWLLELQKNKQIFSDGWYIPPPHGIGALFGTLQEKERLNFPTLRDKNYWPRKDVFLNRKEGIITLYASPVDRRSGTIGDFGTTLYFGKNKNIQQHLKDIFRLNTQIFDCIKIGMQIKSLYSYASNLLQKQNYTNSGWISISDPAKINMGHSIPIMTGIWKKDDISKKRIFLNRLEITKIQPGIAFTIEARLKSLSKPDLPTSYFHMIALVKENGKKELLTGFENIFKLVGMNYMP